MNTEREIKEIKERLDRIEAFLKGTTGGGQTSDSEPSYELLDLQVKRSEKSFGGPEYAYRLMVKNSSGSSLRFIGNIIFLDSGGFEVDRYPMDVFTVQAGQTHTQTGKATITDEYHVPRIADVTAEIYPI